MSRESLLRRLAIAGVRFGGDALRIPGWFPLVVERVHPYLRLSDRQDIEIESLAMRLDLRDYTQRRIYYRAHEPNEVRFCRRFVRRGDVTLDVGANVGLYTLLFASLVGSTGQVHAFEPVPANVHLLRANIERNGLSNVRVNAIAVGAAAGETTLGLEPNARAVDGVSGRYGALWQEDAFRVPVCTLDRYVDAHVPASARLRLVKIDVEGMETEVVRGFDKTLRAGRPDGVLVEVNAHVLRARGSSPQELIGRFLGAGYRTYRLTSFGRLDPLHSADARPRGVVSPPTEPTGVVGEIRAGLAFRRAFYSLIALRRGAERA